MLIPDLGNAFLKTKSPLAQNNLELTPDLPKCESYRHESQDSACANLETGSGVFCVLDKHPTHETTPSASWEIYLTVI